MPAKTAKGKDKPPLTPPAEGSSEGTVSLPSVITEEIIANRNKFLRKISETVPNVSIGDSEYTWDFDAESVLRSKPPSTLPLNKLFWGKDRNEVLENIGWRNIGSNADINEEMVNALLSLDFDKSPQNTFKLVIHDAREFGEKIIGLPQDIRELMKVPLVEEVGTSTDLSTADITPIDFTPVLRQGFDNLQFALGEVGASAELVAMDAKRVGLMTPEAFVKFLETVETESVLQAMQRQLDSLLLSGVDDKAGMKRGITPETYKTYTKLIDLKRYTRTRAGKELTRAFPKRKTINRSVSFFN